MYGPDFKTILNEYAEITGRMEMYGKWAHGFMLSKYGNDNATQEEFLEWIHRLRDEDYPVTVMFSILVGVAMLLITVETKAVLVKSGENKCGVMILLNS